MSINPVKPDNSGTVIPHEKHQEISEPNEHLLESMDDALLGYLKGFVENEVMRSKFGLISFDQIVRARIGDWITFLIKDMPSNFYKFNSSIQTKPALYTAFFQAFFDFQKSGDSKPLCDLIEQSLHAVESALSQESLDSHFDTLAEVTNTLTFLQEKACTPELLQKKPLNLFPKFKIKPSDLSKAGGFSYRFLWNAIAQVGWTTNDCSLVKSHEIQQQVFQIFNSELILFSEKQGISKDQKNSILFFGRSFVKNFNKKRDIANHILTDLKALLPQYVPIFPDSTDLTHMVKSFLKNRNLWEAFLPLVIEYRDVTDDAVQNFEKIFVILKYFPLYLHLGDLNRLQERIEQDPSQDRSVIIREEIQAFATNKKSQLEVLKFLKDQKNQSIAELYKAVVDRKKKLSDMHSSLHSFLDPAIATTQELSPFLFQEKEPQIEAGTLEEKGSAPKKMHHEKVPKAHPRKQKNREVLKLEDLDENHGLERSEAAMPVAKTSSTRPRPLTFEQRLQGLKTGMISSLDLFRKNKECNQFGVVEALTNCEVHWECLLSSMKKLIEAEGAMSNPELFSIVIDVVRESSLVIEQMMAALERKSNNVKDKAAHKKLLTHNLLQMLWSCKFKHGTLPPEVRTWIRQMNYGEIVSRDLRDCKIDGTYAEKLLTKARLIGVNSTTFSQKEVIAHTIEYFKRTGLICFELQKNMLGIHDKISPLEVNFLAFCAEIDTLFSVESTPVEKSSNYDVQGITSPIIEFRRLVPMREVQSSLDNVLSNLCLQLQAEMNLHATLEPIDAYRHMSKIILLNQMIAEQYLLNLHDALNISYDLSKVDHDLATLVTSLGMTENDFSKKEWDFLSQGKPLRMLVRYPDSYNTVYEKEGPVQLRLEKAVRDALIFSRSQVFQKGNVTDEGFTVASKNFNDIKSVVTNDLDTLTKILKKVSERMHPVFELETSEGKH